MRRILWLLLLAMPASLHAQDVPAARFDPAAIIQEGPPMSADRAASLARESAPTVEQARALGRAAEAAVSQARAAMLPRLDLSARYAHVDGFPDGQVSLGGDPAATEAARMLAMRVTDPAAQALWLGTIESQASGGVTFTIPRDQVALGARLTWPVSDLFFALLPAMEAAEAGARARERQLAVSEAMVALRARETYYQLARARGAHAVAQQSARQAEAQLEQVEAAVRAGLGTEADALAARSRLASIEQAIASAEAGVLVADAALRALTGEDDGPPHGITDPVLDATDGALEAVPVLTERALAQRLELEVLRATLAAQRAAGRASDARGYPHLSLFAGADLARPNRYVIPPSENMEPSWEVGAMLTWSPNDTLSAVHRGEELAAEAAVTEARIVEAERAVRLEVRRAHAELHAARVGIVAARAAEEAAEAAYASRLAQHRAGEATVAELLAAEAQLDAARLRALDAAIGVASSRARLTYAIGE